VTSASPRRWRGLRRILATALAAGALWLLAALPASAHVHVEANDANAGGFAVLTFRVPNESDTAGTVRLEVTLPTDTPLLSVSTKPVPGWKASTAEAELPAPVEVSGTTVTKAVRTVTWTAQRGVQIGPGQFQEFAISVGPLPGPSTITLPATQTYSDGTVVAWDQPTPASGEEPEHPAPAFTVEPAAADEDHHRSAGASSEPNAAPASTAPSSTGPASTGASTEADGTGSSGADPVARVLAGLALVAGLGALAVSLVALGRRGAR
jgi:uncharacterized protein YcnI